MIKTVAKFCEEIFTSKKSYHDATQPAFFAPQTQIIERLAAVLYLCERDA